MRRGCLRGAYRAIAALVLCSLAAFQLEALIADVCDGDATPAQLAAFAGPASDLAPDAAATAAATAAAVAAARASDPVPPAPLPAHGAHVCHCIHAHGGVLPRLETVVVPTVAIAIGIPSGRHLAPRSITTEPRLRPPLA